MGRNTEIEGGEFDGMLPVAMPIGGGLQHEPNGKPVHTAHVVLPIISEPSRRPTGGWDDPRQRDSRGY
jgi:hypothetical protein